MTENEAIRDLQYLVGEYSAYPPETGVSTTIGSLQYCISALKEIWKYREIGTVEECREAVEKQKQKKPVLRNDNGKLRKSCPVCGCFFSPLSRSCPKCGQAIQWDANLEGME